MNTELFKKLTANVSIGREHKSFFKYNDEVCKIICSRFAATDEDFYLESIEKDSGGVPYESRPLLDVYEDKLTILIEKPCTCEGKVIEVDGLKYKLTALHTL